MPRGKRYSSRQDLHVAPGLSPRRHLQLFFLPVEARGFIPTKNAEKPWGFSCGGLGSCPPTYSLAALSRIFGAGSGKATCDICSSELRARVSLLSASS